MLFDLGEIGTGKTIQSAKLHVYLAGITGIVTGDGDCVNVFKPTDATVTSWSEGSGTWNNTHQNPGGTESYWAWNLVESNNKTFTSIGWVVWDINVSKFTKADKKETLVLKSSAAIETGSVDKYLSFYGKDRTDTYQQDAYLEVTYVPEPATMTLLLLGLPFALRRRK